MQRLACFNDLKSGCEPERFIKDEKVVAECKHIIENNFDPLHTVFLELSSNSDQYPEIDASTFLEAVMAQQSKLPDGVAPLNRAEVELAFLSATRNDKVGRMKGALCRGEFFEVILRLAVAVSPKDEYLSIYLPQFIQDQLTVTLENSEILNGRARIRSNATINQLLWDNKALLRKLYSYFKSN